MHFIYSLAGFIAVGVELPHETRRMKTSRPFFLQRVFLDQGTFRRLRVWSFRLLGFRVSGI